MQAIYKHTNSMISVIIATRGRGVQLYRCIRSILKNDFADFEILILEQKTAPSSGLDRIYHKNTKVITISLNNVGKSIALNEGIIRAKGDICAFTDDDCIVSDDWLSRIDNYFARHKNIAGVFGNTYPYQPNKHKSLSCPSVMELNSYAITDNPYIVVNEKLGMGNNMSIKKSVLINVGPFKKWLGPKGLIGGGGDEGELAYRILKLGYKLAHDPSIRVHHDRWQTYPQYQIQQSQYSVGALAYTSYHFLKSKDTRILLLARHYIDTRLFAMVHHVIYQITHIPFQPKKWSVRELLFAVPEIIAIMIGTLRGTFYAITDN